MPFDIKDPSSLLFLPSLTFEIVRLLAIQRHIKKRLKDLEGTTAHDIAKDHGHVGVRLFLRSPYIST
ncbi:unnamed protein product [Penicillium camemberti]|uniref:Str. FM013 n=1 Tax=Penicillium camemberti (strain FM 013) TaxID=1429867 RepID=A0A0G4P8M5_PENC3|nr:unnamed protein product [Penicillium camemberti]